MSQNGKSFEDVRALLGKLDRGIDEARSKRLGPSVGETKEPEREPISSSIDLDQEVGGSSEPKPMTELQRKRASFGRARPLNRNENPGGEWKSGGGSVG